MEIIVLIIIISFLAIILFIALKKLISTITEDSKNYYLKKIQDYDEQIYEKEKQLQSLEPKTEEEVKIREKEIKSTSFDKSFLDVLNQTEYETVNVLKIANKVDEIFNIDEEKIIKDFVSKHAVDENYKILEAIEDKFSPNLIYKLKMLNTESQIKEISKLLNDEEYEIFNSYLERKKFNLDKFLLELSLLLERTKPHIEVITGNHNKNYDYLSKYIKTTYSEDIYKGIIIKYQNQIYDYSIDERDV